MKVEIKLFDQYKTPDRDYSTKTGQQLAVSKGVYSIDEWGEAGALYYDFLSMSWKEIDGNEVNYLFKWFYKPEEVKY